MVTLYDLIESLLHELLDSTWRSCTQAAPPDASLRLLLLLGRQLFSQVRAQVREELRALLYGNQLVSLSQTDSPDDGADDQAALPDSLLEWLAERYVSGADLRASLASLELSILRNVSQQLEQQLEQCSGVQVDKEDDHNDRQTVVTRTVVDSLNAAGAGVTEEVFTISPSQ